MRWFPATLVLVAGCQLSSDSSPRETNVRNGTPDHEHHAVGVLWARGAQSWKCTATLIHDRRTLLTAAHCIESGNTLFTFENPATGAEFPIVQMTSHPDWRGRLGDVSDLAIARLGSDVEGVEPMQISATVPRQAEEFTMVGFGGPDNPDTERRKNTNLITNIHEYSFSIDDFFDPNVTCEGDSGGPALRAEAGVERIIGVASEGNCGPHLGLGGARGSASWARTDLATVHQWIETTIDSWSVCRDRCGSRNAEFACSCASSCIECSGADCSGIYDRCCYDVQSYCGVDPASDCRDAGVGQQSCGGCLSRACLSDGSWSSCAPTSGVCASDELCDLNSGQCVTQTWCGDGICQDDEDCAACTLDCDCDCPGAFCTSVVNPQERICAGDKGAGGTCVGSEGVRWCTCSGSGAWVECSNGCIPI